MDRDITLIAESYVQLLRATLAQAALDLRERYLAVNSIIFILIISAAGI